MGDMIRPNDPPTVTKTAWGAFFSVSRTRLYLWWLGKKRTVNKFICRRRGHKAGGKEVQMPDDRKMVICPRCGTYENV